MSNFVNTMHILGRFPELSDNQPLLNWLGTYGGDVWHETPVSDEGYITVIVQSKSKLNIFAALLQRDISRIDEGIIDNKLVRTDDFDLTIHGAQAVPSGMAALIVGAETGASSTNIHAIRPIVDLRVDKPQISWEVEVMSNTTLKTFNINSQQVLTKVNEVKLKKSERIEIAKEKTKPTSDWLEENECHHVTTWSSLARQMAGTASTTADRAFAIWVSVRQRMVYDGNITNISEFTCSDNLTINQNGWRGICDEWAVVQITLLRALGIPATLKFLIWNNGDVGHACLEWNDNGNWRHMDALWNAFDDRAIYRKNGALNVTVMDGTSPRDSRYGGLAWGVLDVPGDQRFYPYGDFIINPTYPGNQRPGYSY
ncbi:transglutaminase-like domain-containing protein [Rufibacter glacialis]|uniref:Transglutaminase domain-containing protein n=1 Tax=Rufibacter glacialis TaxID=1259555 RepID=A0A5M8Q9A2_9BACT|nr:transglutaminase-like domain-containing protein [Rufibacter glacialis]KAA6432505.1 transglutaminase domain-containing protein [Rufibacter glacialis]GGK79247.1 hypothetical protein GCM10011405_28880 [Rufibacter glacialis]